jgi:hypothetical protein
MSVRKHQCTMPKVNLYKIIPIIKHVKYKKTFQFSSVLSLDYKLYKYRGEQRNKQYVN